MGIGLSDVPTNASWAASLGYEYEVWADDGTLTNHYDVMTDFDDAPLRHAYLLDETGTAVLFYEGAVSVGADPQAVLQDARELLTPVE